jgi:hypothetical protein
VFNYEWFAVEIAAGKVKGKRKALSKGHFRKIFRLPLQPKLSDSRHVESDESMGEALTKG